jgi:hypothetical protein
MRARAYSTDDLVTSPAAAAEEDRATSEQGSEAVNEGSTEGMPAGTSTSSEADEDTASLGADDDNYENPSALPHPRPTSALLFCEGEAASSGARPSPRLAS